MGKWPQSGLPRFHLQMCTCHGMVCVNWPRQPFFLFLSKSEQNEGGWWFVCSFAFCRVLASHMIILCISLFPYLERLANLLVILRSSLGKFNPHIVRKKKYIYMSTSPLTVSLGPMNFKKTEFFLLPFCLAHHFPFSLEATQLAWRRVSQFSMSEYFFLICFFPMF